MAAAILELGLSNLVVAAALAVVALAAGRWGRWPAVTHALWLLVLLKLITPPVVNLPVRLLPAEKVAEAAPIEARAEAPRAVAHAEPSPSAAELPVVDSGHSVPLPVIPPAKPEQFKAAPSAPSVVVTTADEDPPIPPGEHADQLVVNAPPIPLGPIPAVAVSTLAAADPAAEAPRSPAAVAPAAPFPWPQVVLALWVGGAVVWLGLVAWRIRCFARVLRLAETVPPWFAREVADMAEVMGFRSAPRARLIPGAVAPMVWSLGRTTIYFPAELIARLSSRQRSSLVAHELAHLKRGDHRVRWLELAVLALYWWCPLAWLARRELQRAEEECCDAWVVATLAEGDTYAAALLDTLDFLAETPPAPALASGMGAAATIKRRLQLILDGRTPKRLPVVGRMLVVLAALLLLPVAPKLTRLVGAATTAEIQEEPKEANDRNSEPKKPGVLKPAGPPSNPRGEPLLYETGSPNVTEVRPGGLYWWAVAVSPDGKSIATSHGNGNTPGQVRLWDRESGKVKWTADEPKGTRSVAISPDGKIIASGCFDGALRFYDSGTGKLWAVAFETSGGRGGSGVNCVCFIGGGKYLATAGPGSVVRLWDVEAVRARRGALDPVRFSPVAVFEGHTGGMLTVSASEDGRTLLSGGTDQTARVWDVPEKLPKWGDGRDKPLIVKKERVLLRGHASGVEAIAVSPDGELLVTGSWDRQLLVRNRDGKKVEISATFQNQVLCAAFSKDGKYLAVGAGASRAPGQPGEVRVWDVAAKKEIAHRADFPEAVLGVAFTPDGKTVAAVGRDQGLHLWPHAEKDRRTIHPEGISYSAQPILGAAISPNGDFLAFSNESRSVFIFSRRAGTLVAELTGHEDVVAGLAFSPDGKTLATGSYDKTVKLWDVTTWKEQRELKGHTGWVLAVTFSPDGKTLATASYDKTIRLWDAATGAPQATWKDHTAGVRSVAFSPDGKKLVSGGSDRIVRVWDVAESKVLVTLKGHKGAVRSVAFSPDGKIAASGSEDRTVTFWDAMAGVQLKTINGLPEMVTTIRFSPKGQTLAAGTFQGPVAILDPLTGRTRQTLRAHSDSVTGLAFADDGQNLITVSLDRTIRQWPAVPPSAVAPARQLANTLGIVTAVAVTPDGKTAILGGADGTLSQWDILGNRLVEFPLSPPIPGGVAHVAASADGLVAAASKNGQFWVIPLARGRDVSWSGTGRLPTFIPNGKHVAVVDGKDVVLHDATTGKEVRRCANGHTGNVVHVAFSPDGKRMASAGEDTTVRLWDATTSARQQVTPPIGNYVAILGLAFSPDGMKLAVAANGPEAPPPEDMAGNFQLIRGAYLFPVPATGDEAWPPKDPPRVMHPTGELTALAWAADGRALVTTGTDGLIRLWDAADRKPIQAFRGHEAAVATAAMSAEGGVFVTAGEDLAIKRWALPGSIIGPGQARLISPGLTRVWEATSSPDGRYLVAAGEGDKAFRVYAGLPSAIPVEPDKHGAVFGLAFSPDGKFLVTGHEKGVLMVREAATGKPIRALTGHVKRVSSVAFAENGAALVTVGGNRASGKEAGEAFVWDFPGGTIRHKLDAPAYQWMAAVHPDGKTAAIAASDGRVRVFDVGTGKPVTSFGKAGIVQKSVAFSPDGRKIVAAGNDQAVRVYDVATGAEARRISVPEMLLTDARFSPDGSEVVVAAWKGAPPTDRPPVLAAYSLANADAPPRAFPTHPVSVMSLAFLDGKTLVAAGGENNGLGSVWLYDYATAKPIGRLTGHRHWGQSVAVSPNGKMIASSSWATATSGELRLWDARGFHPMAQVKVPGETNYISSSAISPDGKLLVLGGWGQTLSAWNMTDPARPVLRKALKVHKAGLRSVAFDAAGKRFISADGAGVVKVWDAATLDLIVSFQASADGVYRAKFTPDGRDIVTVSGNWQARVKGEIRVWDPTTGKETGRFPDQNREVWDVGFLDGGRLMITVGTLSGDPDDAHIKIWDYASRQVVRMPVPNGTFVGARCQAASADGKYLAVGSNTGPVKVFDTSSWQEVLNLSDLIGCEFRVDFAPDGKNLVIANGDGAAIVVRLPLAQ